MMDNAAILSPNCVIYGKGTAFRKSYLVRLMKSSNNFVCQSVSPMYCKSFLRFKFILLHVLEDFLSMWNLFIKLWMVSRYCSLHMSRYFRSQIWGCKNVSANILLIFAQSCVRTFWTILKSSLFFFTVDTSLYFSILPVPRLFDIIRKWYSLDCVNSSLCYSK